MSALDDHCIITKYELTEKEKQMKKAFFNPTKKKGESNKTEINNSKRLDTNQNLITKNINDEVINKLIKENVDPLVSKNLKYLNLNGGDQQGFLPLNIVYNQNKILERNVDILQETQRSLKDFFIYNLQHSNGNSTKKTSNKHARSDSYDDKKFLVELIKPLYQNMENIKLQVNNLIHNKPNKNNDFEEKNKDEIYQMQKNLKNSTSKVEKSLNLVEQHTSQTKKDNEMIKLIEEIKGSINNVHKEMSKIESDVNQNFNKIYEETQKQNLLNMVSGNRTNKKLNKQNLSNKNENHNNNFAKILSNLNNNEQDSIINENINYGEFKKDLCDINLQLQEIKNDYEISKSKINIVPHKLMKADKIEFSYDIDFKDPFSFNSFTTNDDSLIVKENKKLKAVSEKKNFLTKNKEYIDKLSKNKEIKNKSKNNNISKESEENYDTTDHEIFNKNKNANKKNNIFLDNLNKSIDSKNIKNEVSNIYKDKENKILNKNNNQSTNYTINSPSVAQNNTNSLMNSNTKNKINIINEEENESEKNKKNDFLENAKSEFDKINKNEKDKIGKKGLKDILKQKTVINEKSSKQAVLKDLVTKVLIEKILVDKNKKINNEKNYIIGPATNEEINFFLREKEFSGKYGTGKYLNLDMDEKNAREITENVVKERIKKLLNHKKLRNMLTKNNKVKNDEEELNAKGDMIKNLEDELFNKLNKENSQRDSFLNQNFKYILERLGNMEKNMNMKPSENNDINFIKNLENKEKLIESQYIEIDKTDKKVKNYDDMIDKITDRIKSNMHITINLNDGKNNIGNVNVNNANMNKNLNFQTETLNILADKNNNYNQNKTDENCLGYTHPFADRNKIIKMLDTNYINKENLIENIPLPHTINFKDFDVSSESCFTESKRTEINNDGNKINIESNYNSKNNFFSATTNPNLQYITNIDNKIHNYQTTGKYAEDHLGYINSLMINSNKKNYINTLNSNTLFKENYIIDTNLSPTEMKRQIKYNHPTKNATKDESISEGQVPSISGLNNESELESFYSKSHRNIDDDNLNDINRKILINQQKLEELNKRNMNLDKNRELNLNDLRNINKDLEETLEKYKDNKNPSLNVNNNFNNPDKEVNDYDESSNNKYEISNSNFNEDDTERKMYVEEIQENKNYNNNSKNKQQLNKNSNSEMQMEEKIKFLKNRNLYDSDEQENFQKTFQNVLRKNNVINNSNNTSQGSNFHNILSNFNNNNNNLTGSLASSGKMRLGSGRQNNFLSNNMNNINHIYQSFGGSIINNNQMSNRSNQIIPNNSNRNINYNINSPSSNISSNINSSRIPNESLNSSNGNNENFNNYVNNNNADKYYYGYNNTISENYTESNESIIDRGMNNNNKMYKTDESSLDLQN